MSAALKISDELDATLPEMGIAATHISHLIASANSDQLLDDAARHLWREHGNGTINDVEATYLQNLIQRRRPPSRHAPCGPAASAGKRVPGRFLKHPLQRSPNRERSWLRRGQLAASGALPPPQAASLTKCELAYARIIRDEFMAHGRCALSLDEIAARAGFERKAAQRAQKRLAELKLITVTERKQPGRRNLTNIVKIVSREWLTWIARGPHIGGQKCPPTGRGFPTAKFSRVERPQGGSRGRKFARWSPPPPPDRGGGDG